LWCFFFIKRYYFNKNIYNLFIFYQYGGHIVFLAAILIFVK